jgi:uncharacterized membrane protein YoaK (UPF0700 family)
MSENKDYSKFTLEELLVEQKKIKKEETVSSVIIGFFVGVIIFGLVKNGFGWVYISISLIMIFAIYGNSKKRKQNFTQIQTEINKKNIE